MAKFDGLGKTSERPFDHQIDDQQSSDDSSTRDACTCTQSTKL